MEARRLCQGKVGGGRGRGGGWVGVGGVLEDGGVVGGEVGVEGVDRRKDGL